MGNKPRRLVSLVLVVGLLFQQVNLAQAAGALNLAGYLNNNAAASSALSQDKFRPVQMRYFSYEPDSDNFKILLDKGDLNKLEDKNAKEEAQTLLSYFLVGVSMPDDAFWVNLRPDSQDQIIDPLLEKTEVGRIMLAADLQIKKDTSRMTSPQTPEGKAYWDKLYKKAGELFGTENITIPTITRPWIVPGEIIVRESQNSVYVYKAGLKVMLEEDYLNNQKTEKPKNPKTEIYSFSDPRLKELNQYSTQLIKELIIPQLTKEINSSKRYASLRQVYYSLILSRWFKLRFSGKSGSYASLINTGNLTNLTSQKPWDKSEYFNQYRESFAKGEYNLKEQVYTTASQSVRSYVSGGVNWASSAINTENGAMFSDDNIFDKLPGIKIRGVASNPTDMALQPAVAASPIKIEEALDLIRSKYYDKDNKIREAVKLIAEQGDDASKKKVVDVMYRLATDIVESSRARDDWDHFEQAFESILIPRPELSAFSNMEDYRSLATFSWGGHNYRTNLKLSVLDEIFNLRSHPDNAIQPSASSSLSDNEEQKVVGGIDLRGLPMSIQPMGSFRGLDFGLPRLSLQEIERIDVESQIGQIKNMVSSGISPSGRRVKELVAACTRKGQISVYADDLLACIGDILKLEEEIAKESSPELKKALVIVELA